MLIFKCSCGSGYLPKSAYVRLVLPLLFALCCFFVVTYLIMGCVSNIPKAENSNVNVRAAPLRSDFLQVLISTGKNEIVGTLALVNSIVKNTKAPVHFYFVTDPESSSLLHSHIEGSIMKGISYEIKIFHSKDYGVEISTDEGNELDYSKFFIPKLFPQVDGILICLNNDIIVQGDITKLKNMPISRNGIVSLSTDCDVVSKAFNKNKNAYHDYLNLKNPYFKKVLPIKGDQCVFNMGVMVINMTLWKENNISKQLLDLYNLNKKENIFHINSVLSPFLIIFNNRISSLDHSWHVRHLGITSGTRYSQEYLKQANLLHWDGQFKPWKPKAPYAAIWNKYLVVVKSKT